MEINLPYKVRLVLYVITGMVTPLVAILVTNGFIPDWVSLLWSAEVMFVSGLAQLNITKD